MLSEAIRNLVRLGALLVKFRKLHEELPLGPWEADIDDPGTDCENFTGKFLLPDSAPVGSVCLYDDPKLARQLAELRNLLCELFPPEQPHA